ncbi:MAG: hypothetical protein FWE23_00270 [Chitinivibrionia bacterium]|nr:hypothetical protein [Chitinivibrionia bacterium]
MKKQFWVIGFLVFFTGLVLLSGCGGKSQEALTNEFIESYISQLKEIEIPPFQRWNMLMRILEVVNEDEEESEEALFALRNAITETMNANRQAVDDFRRLALKPTPDFVEDTIRILLRTATAFLGQSYEMRNEAITWLNRYVSLGTARFFDEYMQGMAQAMERSRQAFFFLTMARVRYRIAVGDTLDMTVREFLGIAEAAQLPPDMDEEEINDDEEEN